MWPSESDRTHFDSAPCTIYRSLLLSECIPNTTTHTWHCWIYACLIIFIHLLVWELLPVDPTVLHDHDLIALIEKLILNCNIYTWTNHTVRWDRWLQHWVKSIGSDPTLVVLVSDHQDVTTVAPVLAPAKKKKHYIAVARTLMTYLDCSPVLNKPVILAIIRSVPGHQHGMIELCAGATWRVEYSTLVELCTIE